MEESYNREYTDYVFLAPRRLFIVEAKKEGDYFELPAGETRLEQSLPSLSKRYPNLKEALQQAAGYCQSRGVPFGAVTNGHQLVAFVGTRSDGLPPLEGRALVFPSLQFMLDNFLEFWQAVSKPGIQEKRLQHRLLGEGLPELPPKPSATITSYPGVKGRNNLQTDLQIVSELVIEDLPRSRDVEDRFLEECYSQSGALSQYALTSRAILQARYAALFDTDNPGPNTSPAVGKEGVSAEVFAQSLSRRPVILIGDVGVGKTTFVRHLIKIDAAAVFEHAITLYIDLGSQATLSADLRSFLLEEFVRQLREEYEIDVDERNFVRGVYNQELQRFATGIYADLRDENVGLYRQKEIEFLENKLANREDHLKFSLHHVTRGRRKQVVIFLDNADQRDESTQQATFLAAQELAEHWPATVFVTLRPETFHRSTRIGALSGYHPKAFTVSPPRIDRVINKRLEFALKLTSGDIPIQSLSGNTTVNLDKLDVMIRVFLHSLGNYSLREFIDNISAGNVRQALDLVRGFFGSGHVDTQKIVNIYTDTGRYNVPLHEFLRAVTFGDAEYYDPERSPVANLFDISQVDPKEHFLAPLLICSLTSSSKGSEEGFVETSVVYERLQGFGFTPEQIDAAVVRGHRKKLLETASRRIPYPDHDMPPALRATNVGLYHVSRLCRLFTYVDAVLVDTPILEVAVRQSIGEFRTIASRLHNVEVFCQYLDDIWPVIEEGNNLFKWDSISTDLKNDVKRIRERIDMER